MADTPTTTVDKDPDMLAKLKKDPDGVYKKELIASLESHENEIQKEINQGLTEEDFKNKQALLESVRVAKGLVTFAWEHHNGS